MLMGEDDDMEKKAVHLGRTGVVRERSWSMTRSKTRALIVA